MDKKKSQQEVFRCMCCNKLMKRDLGIFIKVRKGERKGEEWMVCKLQQCMADAENGWCMSDGSVDQSK